MSTGATHNAETGTAAQALADHLFRWNTPDDPYFVINGRNRDDENSDDPYLPIARAALAFLAVSVSESNAESDELDRLRSWKQEAITLFDGLQYLGLGLDLPLGVLVTGPLAVEAANNLRTERDAARTALTEHVCSPASPDGSES